MATVTTKPTMPLPVPVHEIENVLAFTQEKIVMVGKTEIFGTVDTSRFDKIRLVAANEESTCDVHVSLKIIEEPEGERFILDEFTLKPHNQLTRVYDVPATKLEVSVAGLLGRPRATQAEVEILIFGQY
jgi:hypothetical protein